MSTSSDGVLEFLAAVHAADEQAARAAESPYGPWEHPLEDEGELNEVTIFPERGGATIVATTTANEEGHAEAAHIARHDPQSVLARVDAERLVISKYVDAREAARSIRETFGDRPDDQRGRIEVAAYGQAESMAYAMVEAVAWGYRGREGFDPAWTPDGVEVGA